MTGQQLMTTAINETSRTARMGCCVLHSETRFVNLGPLDSEAGAGSKALVWSNFIRPLSSRWVMLIFRPGDVKIKARCEREARADWPFGPAEFAEVENHTGQASNLTYSTPQFFRARFKTFCASVRALAAPSDRTLFTKSRFAASSARFFRASAK